MRTERRLKRSSRAALPFDLCPNMGLARANGFGAAYRNRTDDLRITSECPGEWQVLAAAIRRLDPCSSSSCCWLLTDDRGHGGGMRIHHRAPFKTLVRLAGCGRRPSRAPLNALTVRCSRFARSNSRARTPPAFTRSMTTPKCGCTRCRRIGPLGLWSTSSAQLAGGQPCPHSHVAACSPAAPPSLQQVLLVCRRLPNPHLGRQSIIAGSTAGLPTHGPRWSP